MQRSGKNFFCFVVFFWHSHFLSRCILWCMLGNIISDVTWGVSGLLTSDTLAHATQPRLIRPWLVSQQHKPEHHFFPPFLLVLITEFMYLFLVIPTTTGWVRTKDGKFCIFTLAILICQTEWLLAKISIFHCQSMWWALSCHLFREAGEHNT